MKILGISCYYHDAAACLLEDGKILSAVEEERFTRKKFDDEFPNNAIDFCLQENNVKASDLDYVVFYDKPILKFERLLDNYISVAPKGLSSFIEIIPKWIHKRLWIKQEIKKHLSKFEGKIFFVPHHISHAAYTFFSSPFDDAAIVTIDGVGEWSTTSFGEAKKNKISLWKDIRWPHSLGLFYSAFTYFLGFKVNEGEYKLMGLGAYGTPKYYELILKEIIDVKNDGSFKLDMKYFAFTYDKVMTNNKFAKLFGINPRKENESIEKIHFDIAASVQKVLEEILIKICNHVYEKTKNKNLCLGGGVALNGVANYKIWKECQFERIYVPPSPGDAGSAIGCAQYLYYSLTKTPRNLNESSKIASNVYLGPSYSNQEILKCIEKNSNDFLFLETNELLKTTVELIANKNVVGWFQGKMEWGPRALGNRSILADPRDQKMKDILNSKIKHRESFRPFAPAILLEHVSDYFEFDKESPYMSFVVPVKQEHKIPAVTHIDKTGRLQTVSKETNQLFYNLIDEFFKLTGIPVLINTSMNVKGEPIVNTPNQAISMFMNTDMDYLVLGNYLLKKGD